MEGESLAAAAAATAAAAAEGRSGVNENGGGRALDAVDGGGGGSGGGGRKIGEAGAGGSGAAGAPRRARRLGSNFTPDFSQIASATSVMQDALRNQRAAVEKPPRESVSGTYFFRRVESGQSMASAVLPGGGYGGGVDEDGGVAVFGGAFSSAAAASGRAEVAAANGDLASTIPRGFGFGGFAGIMSSEGDGGDIGAYRSRSGSAHSSSGTGMGMGRHERSKKVTAVFKPADEEFADSSPTDSLSSSPLVAYPRSSPELDHSAGTSRASRMAAAGFHAGEGAYKEVAAYVLDHHNFANVPQTALARFKDGSGDQAMDKSGAFQVYVDNVGDADDWGPGLFPHEAVHRIAILDIRTLNYDRHGGNILVTRGDDGKYDLVPIDHAFTLPEAVQAVPWAIWMDWPAAKEPMSQETIDYIMALDPDNEARLLDQELPGHRIRPRSMRSLKIATRLLQKGATAGLSLYDIGLLIYCREGESLDGKIAKSPLEKIVDEAIKCAHGRRSHMGDMYSTDFEDALPTDGIFRLDGLSINGNDACSGSTSSSNNNSGDGAGKATAVPCPPPRSPLMSSPRNPAHLERSNEDYIVKYASRLMDDLIARAAVNDSSAGGVLARARSIPDFTFGLGPSASSASASSGMEVHQPYLPPSGPISLKFAPSPPRCSSSREVEDGVSPSSPPPIGGLLGRTSSVGVSFVAAPSATMSASRPVASKIDKAGSEAPQTPPLGNFNGKTSPVSPHDFKWERA